MRGDIVVVRNFQDKPLIRRVWDVGKDVVFITNDEQLRRYQLGLPMLPPVGFPAEDVFRLSSAGLKNNSDSLIVGYCDGVKPKLTEKSRRFENALRQVLETENPKRGRPNAKSSASGHASDGPEC
jgi:hypothetical protein